MSANEIGFGVEDGQVVDAARAATALAVEARGVEDVKAMGHAVDLGVQSRDGRALSLHAGRGLLEIRQRPTVPAIAARHRETSA